MLRCLTLVRHGESEWNAARKIQGHLDSGLSQAGRDQARLLRDYLDIEAYETVYSSDLSRAWQTAELATGLEREQITRTPKLREHCFGRWQGLSADEVRERYPEEWSAYRGDPLHNRPEGGESVMDLRDRMSALLDEWHARHDGETILAFTHGGVVRMATLVTMGLPVSPWGVLRVANTGVTRVEFSPDGPFLSCYDATGHLAGEGLLRAASGHEGDER